MSALVRSRAPAGAGAGGGTDDGAQAAWIFQLDSDRQFAVREFSRLWERRDTCDLVLGVRRARRDARHRRALSRVIAAVVSLLVGRSVRDPNVPFRLFRRIVWEDLRPLIGERPLAPSILVTAGAVVRGWRIEEVDVSHFARASGTGSLRPLRLLRFSLRGLAELLRFRYRLARSRVASGPFAATGRR